MLQCYLNHFPQRFLVICSLCNPFFVIFFHNLHVLQNVAIAHLFTIFTFSLIFYNVTIINHIIFSCRYYPYYWSIFLLISFNIYICLHLVVLICSLFVLICSLFALICPYLLLICPYLLLICLYLPLFALICPYVSLFVLICPYLSLFVLICPYLSLFVTMVFPWFFHIFSFVFLIFPRCFLIFP